MDLRALNRGELIAVVGGSLPAISVLLSWYSLGNQFTQRSRERAPRRKPSGVL